MKCPHCGAEVNGSDAFCGDCGKPLRREIEIAPSILREIEIRLNFIWKWRGLTWKWGSMTVSLVLVFLFWAICIDMTYYGDGLLTILLIFGFPTTIYLMYKERTKKIKYGLAWISFPILTFFSGIPYGWNFMGLYGTLGAFGVFIILIIPAIVIDVIYAYKTR